MTSFDAGRASGTAFAAAAFAAAILCAAVAGASAITTKPTAAPAVIKTKLQLSAPDVVHTGQQHPSFAARYWHQQRDFGTGPSMATYGDREDPSALQQQQPPHKLSAVQQVHILDDIRRHNQLQQWWPEPGSVQTTAASLTTTARTRADGGKWPLDAAGDQLQELLQINGATASDDEASAVPNDGDDDRRGRQRSVGNEGDAADAWVPQQLPAQYYNDQNRPQQRPPASLSPYFTPPSVPEAQAHNQQQQPFYPSMQHYPQHRQHQQPQNFVTTPSSSSSSSLSTAPKPPVNGYYPSSVAPEQQHSGGEIDADLEEQIRQQLTEVAGSGGLNYTAPSSPDASAGPGDGRLQQLVSGSASSDNVRYVQIGGGASRNRAQPTAETTASPGTANRNAIVKTVVVRQKPPAPRPAQAVVPPAAIPAIEQQQLEQLARQVLPPGVAQYEIIKAGGVDGGKSDDDTAAVADSAVPFQQPSSGGKKKPVTFVILEERPDGTVRVRGVEKKRAGGGPSDAPDVDIEASADDEQLQKLVDKLNRGELRLPSAPAKAAADSVGAASTASPVPPPPPPASIAVNTRKPSAVTQKTATTPGRQQFQTVFLPTVLPTESVASTAADEAAGPTQNRYHYHQQQQLEQQQQKHQQQYYAPTTIATNSSASSYRDGIKAAAKEGAFSGALRRRGYYAMAKYMRQAGIDAVLEETGPFTIFVPTDKAFRALLVQLGGPDRAEDKFRENPRLLIGLLLHHVVPGAFKAADLKAGDEMTGVSLAGTQLRANLYARQLFDNRWNDIEVLTVNGARVLDDAVSPAATSTGLDDGFPFLDEGAGNGPVQQRRDMVLSTANGVADEGRSGSAGGQQNNIVAIGHAVDRVLFPLPVGDVLATMRADRQRRYSVFLRAVDEYCSPSVRSLLSGSRTVTVFAPMDEAFRSRRGSSNHSSSRSIVDGLFRDEAGGNSGRAAKRERRRAAADRFVLSHVVLAGPGDPPMYTAGLRFYQVRDTAYRLPVESGGGAEEYEDAADVGGADDGSLAASPTSVDGDAPRYYQLTVYKDSGRIRLNGGAAQVLVRNVPATNGVLHGIDAPLV